MSGILQLDYTKSCARFALCIAHRYHRFILILPILCVLFALNSHAVHAQTIVYSDTIPMQTTDWEDVLTLPQFDPSHGVLKRIEFFFKGEVEGDGYYENVSSNENIITLTHRANLVMTNTVLGTLADITPTAQASITAPPYDGSGGFNIVPPVFDAPSGGKLVMFGSATDDAGYSDQNTLTAFTGTGEVQIHARAKAKAGSMDSLGNVDFLLQANAAGVAVVVTYTFDVPGIALIKLTNGADANDPFGADVPRISANGDVTWTYLISNTGTITMPRSAITVTDSQPGVIPVLDLSSDRNQDQLLSPGEGWIYLAHGKADNLTQPTQAITTVDGCAEIENKPLKAYFNLGTVTTSFGQTVTDPSHYCNPPPTNSDNSDEPSAKLSTFLPFISR